MSKLIEQLNWRYATKRMNMEKVPIQKMDIILEAIRLTPSSSGLQPYKIIVISNESLKEEIHLKACSQSQIFESSHLLVFANKTSITPEYIDESMALIARARQIPNEQLGGFSNMVKNQFASISQTEQAVAASKQTYIALGTALIAAASEAIDACPIEGFNPLVLDEILNLKEQDLQSVVLLALGYRNDSIDFLANATKVRKSKEELFIQMV